MSWTLDCAKMANVDVTTPNVKHKLNGLHFGETLSALDLLKIKNLARVISLSVDLGVDITKLKALGYTG